MRVWSRDGRDQEALFGPVASDSHSVWVIDGIASEPGLLEALRSAHARARERFWKLHGVPESLTIDIDDADHCALGEGARGRQLQRAATGSIRWRSYADETREGLEAMLRPDNAGSNTVADHKTVLDLALRQILAQYIERLQILVRADTAGPHTGNGPGADTPAGLNPYGRGVA